MLAVDCIADSILLLKNISLLLGIPRIEVEVTLVVGLVVVAGGAGFAGFAILAGFAVLTGLTVLAYSFIFGGLAVLAPVAFSIDGPYISVLTILAVLAVLNGKALGLAVLLHVDDNTLAISGRNNRSNHTTLRNLLRDIIDSRLVLGDFLVETVNVVVVVLTGRERSRHRCAHKRKKRDFQ